MNINFRHAFRAMVVMSLGAGLLTIAPSCVVRARVTPVTVTDTAPPDPAPRYQRPAPRAGYVWVRGRYEYRGNRYVWTRGRWQRSRAGQRWQPGHWEQRGRRWHWVRGRWVRGARIQATGTVRPPVRDDRRPPVHDNRRPPVQRQPPVVLGPPRSAPPPPRYRVVSRRPGQVWLKGHWKWDRGQWTWTDGRWARARNGYRWQPARWEARGGVYVMAPGTWVVVRRRR